MPSRPIITPLCSLLFLLTTYPALGTIFVTWQETPQGVLATYTGTIDLSLLTLDPSSPTPFSPPAASVRNNQSFAFYDGTPLDEYLVPGALTPALPDNGGQNGVTGTIGLGNPFGFSREKLWLPAGYQSNTPLSGQTLFDNLTFQDVFQASSLTTLNNTDFIAWQNPQMTEFIIYHPIPEPTPLLLLATSLTLTASRQKPSRPPDP